MKKTNFISRLIARFGHKKVNADLKKLKGKALVGTDRDEDDKRIYTMPFREHKLPGSLFRNGKFLYRIITERDNDGLYLMERRVVR